MSAVIFSSKPWQEFPTQAQAQATVAGALSDARSPDASGRSGRDTERSSQNSFISMLYSTTLTHLDESVLEEKKLKLDDENKKLLLNKGCFAGWNASTIGKNQEKINQINSALKNPKSVKIEFKQVSFSIGLSHLKIHEIQRSISLDSEYLCMNKISLSAFQAKLLNFRNEINKEIRKEIQSHQDIPVSGISQKIEGLETLQNNFEEFLKSIPLNLSKKELETLYSQRFDELKQNFNKIMIKKD